MPWGVTTFGVRRHAVQLYEALVGVAALGAVSYTHLEARRAELRAEYDLLAEKIRAVTLTFTARAGDSGKLYGSITTAQIADKLNEKLGTEIDRRKVGGEPLRQLGEHHISVRLSGDHHPEFLVVVQPEGGLPTPAVVPAAVVAAELELETDGEEEALEA